METIITKFVSLLRKEGLRVSPGESLDAVCALAYGGLTGRESVRALLRLTLVKNVADISTFDWVFDHFFSPYPDGMGIDPADLLQEVIANVEGMQMLGTNPEMINENMTLANVNAKFDLDDLKNPLALWESDFDQLDGSEMYVKMKGVRRGLDAPRPTSMPMGQQPITVAFKPPVMAQKIDVSVTQRDIDEMDDAVSKMILRLKKDIRRVKNMENRGKIHVIRTIQKNYRNGMVPFQLALRRRRKQKPRLVVLCDVSFSVSHASKFMLLLLHTLHNRLMDVRSFIFNAELAEITEMLNNAPINTMLEQIEGGEIIDLDENSNYGEVLLTFKEKFLENLRGRPAVIFLGDARNNFNDANDWVLEQLREKAGYMLWLTPEDRSLWKRGDCIIEKYGAWCDNAEMVKSVDQLNDIVEDLFRKVYLEEEHRSMKRFKKKEEEEQTYNYRDYYTRGGSGAAPQFDPTARSHW